MDGSLRATCPRCRSSLRIPAHWVGQTVKCKNCGAVVRSKLKPGVVVPDGGEMDSEIVELPPGALPVPEVLDEPLAAGSPFDEMGKPMRAATSNPFDSHHDADPNGFAPTSPEHPVGGYAPPPGYDPAAAGYAPPPGYPYPMPPGYGPPPGYPYPMPPGYPYPMPPGYAPPSGYAPPPGYPYPMPPGYPPQGYAPPPGYPYPAPQPAAPVAYAPPPPAAPRPQPAPAPAPAPESSVFKADEAVIGSPARRTYRKASSGSTFVWVGLCVLLTAGLVAGGIYLKNANTKKPDTVEKHEKHDKDHKDNKDGGKDTKGTKGGTSTATATAGSTPRRMLFIHVSNYLFLNPLTSAAESGTGSRGVDLVKPAAARFAFEWRIPDRDPSQLFVLSDTLSNTDSRFPLKPVITGTYEKFFDTSRAQDRVVVYFGGHAVEKDGKAYLVPAEGELDEVPSLIPLEDFYAKLTACKATQKVVIWDVCRFNFQRGKQRPGSEPMSEGLFKALSTPPAGVQAVVTASPGQNALEFFDLQPDGMPQRGKGISSVAGSNFLDAMRFVAEKGKVSNRNAAPAEPLPVAAWVEAINKRVGEVAAYATQSAGSELKQTVTLNGAAPETLVAHDPSAKAAERFEIPQPPRGAGSGEIGSIETEYNVPPFKPDLEAASLAMYPFTEEAIKDFKATEPLDDLLKDKEKNKFVAKTYEAFQTIRDVWSTGVDGSKLRNTIEMTDGKVTEATKKIIKDEQVVPATAILKLETAMVELETVAAMKAEQPKRWQAHYDYAMALLKARQAYMHEYDLLMGNVHTDTLPATDPKQGHVGLKLLTTDKMKSKKDVKDLAAAAVTLYEQMIKDYPGTPWAMAAKREKGVPLGLQWQPYSAGDKDK
jgi:hypothetical protein